jgi:redox-sensitive bicupin YhaK (pirin superfamily)
MKKGLQPDPDIQSLPARQTELGSLKILRALPRSQRRMVGPWCFLDRYGPVRFTNEKPMDVAPHPHMGLQTVSWLLEGEMIHHDSIGGEALMRAGQLNLMTSGRGIAHAEETPHPNSGRLSGVQLWVALPDEFRDGPPTFDHYAVLPAVDLPGITVKLIAGDLLGHSSPARTFSPIVGAQIDFHDHSSILLPLKRDFEHAVFSFEGDLLLNNRQMDRDTLHYLGTNRDEVHLTGNAGSRVLLIGGEPFGERIVMWWNFVARTQEEIAQAREDWLQHQRFGEVKAYKGPRLPAPELTRFAPANPAS